jgi:hypothetical protein
MANFLTAESLIVDRLQDKVDAADWTGKKKPRVLTTSQAAQVEERSQVVPAIYVVLDGYQPVEQVGAGAITSLESTWSIVVAVRSAKSHDSGDGIREDATALIDLVLDALLGFKPSPAFAAMKAAPSPGPAYTDAGFGYFPLIFTTRSTSRGSVT